MYSTVKGQLSINIIRSTIVICTFYILHWSSKQSSDFGPSSNGSNLSDKRNFLDGATGMGRVLHYHLKHVHLQNLIFSYELLSDNRIRYKSLLSKYTPFNNAGTDDWVLKKKCKCKVVVEQNVFIVQLNLTPGQ